MTLTLNLICQNSRNFVSNSNISRTRFTCFFLYATIPFYQQRLAPTWDELAVALEYDATVSISKIDCTQHRPICVDYDVKGYPSLLWIVDGKRVDKYTGARSLDDLKAYVEKTATSSVAKTAQKTVGEQQAAPSGLAEETGVLLITGDNFDHAIERGVTFVKFYAPW